MLLMVCGPLLEAAASLALLVAVSRLRMSDGLAQAEGGGRLRGGHAGAPTPAFAPAPAPAPSASATRLQISSGLVTAAIHVLAVVTKVDKSMLLRHPWFAGSLLASLIIIITSLLVLPALAPAYFQRHRHAIRAATRLIFLHLRDARSTMAFSHILQAQTPGQGQWLLSDTWRFILGTRIPALLAMAGMCPLPVLPHLALSAFALHNSRDAAYMCGLPMLRHATWQHRITTVHNTVDVLPLLVPTSTAPAAARDAAIDCKVFLDFFELLLGVALPTIVLAKCQAPMAPAAGDMHPSSSSSGIGGRSQRYNVGGGAEHRGNSSCGRLHAWLAASRICLPWLHRAAFEADESIHHLCAMLTGGAASWVLSLAAWWLLLSLLWVLALVMVGA